MTSLDPKQLHRLKSVRSPDILLSIACDANGRAFVGSSDAHLYELDLTVEKPERTSFSGEGHRSYVTGLAVVDSIIVSGAYDGQLVWWDLKERALIKRVTAHDKWIRRVIALPGGKWVASIADDMRCRVWDRETGQRVADFSDHPEMTPHHFPSMLYAIAASDDGKYLATGDKVGHVAIWSTESWSKVGQVESPGMYTWDPKQRRHSIGGIRSLAFSPDGKQLAVGGVGKIGNIDHLDGKSRLELFDWQSSQSLRVIEDEKCKGLIEQLAWISPTPPDGSQGSGSSWIIAAGGDNKGFINVVDPASGEIVQQSTCDTHVHAFAWNAAQQQLAIAMHQRVESWSFTPAT